MNFLIILFVLSLQNDCNGTLFKTEIALQLHIDETHEIDLQEKPKELDFFEEHENFESTRTTTVPEKTVVISNNSPTENPLANLTKPTAQPDSGSGPTINLADIPVVQAERKSTIGGRKVQPKKGVSSNLKSN